ncbi:MAG: HU family DNA-binding protein [bacterium]
MNKSELVSKISKDTKTSKAIAENVLNSFIQNVKSSLKKGHNLTLVGFGTFSVAKRKSRSGRNPQTGKIMTIPAKKVPKFRAGKGLKEVVM